MKQEDKELLIKDLCARLPYGVICNIGGYNARKLRGIEDDGEDTLFNFGVDVDSFPIQVYISEVKPYLFPMSSMTKKQMEDLYENHCIVIDSQREMECNCFISVDDLLRCFDWLNVNHFDYRGLIDKGLAIDAANLNIY